MNPVHASSPARSADRAIRSGLRARAIGGVRIAAPWWPLAAALTCGTLLRLWGISSGVPHALNVDEPVIMSNAVRIIRTGDLHPHFFDYPALFIYIQAATACVRFVAGAAQGLWSSLEQAGLEHFYLWGRIVTAAFGVGTIALVYASGTYWGRAQAGLAAAIVAVFPMHVRESHYVLTDVPVTFFVALALWLSLRAAHAPSAPAFAWAGVAVGCGVATKYTAVAGLVIPLVAAYGAGGRAPYLMSTLAGAAAAFLVCAPYTVLDLPAFLNAFAYLSTYYRSRPGAEPGWIVYLKHLRLALAWPGMLLLLGGLAHAVYSGLARSAPWRWWILAVFPLAYFAFISRQGLIFGRYLMPLVPFVALLLATVIFRIADWGRRAGGSTARAWVAAMLMAVVLVPQAVTSVAFDRSISRPSTTAAAYAWLLQHVPPGATVVVEDLALHLPEKRYDTHHVKRLIDRAPEAPEVQQPVYLVASSWMFGRYFEADAPEARAKEAYEQLFAGARELVRVSPSATIAGPEIRVYLLER